MDQNHGVPQGCVLSLSLCLIMINDVFNDIHKIYLKLKYSLYADDLAVWFSHPCVDRANQFIQLALNYTQEWCLRWGMQISPAKSASVIFSKQRRHLEPTTPFTFNGEIIPLVKSFKFLGVTLDRSLTFIDHFQDIKQRC